MITIASDSGVISDGAGSNAVPDNSHFGETAASRRDHPDISDSLQLQSSVNDLDSVQSLIGEDLEPPLRQEGGVHHHGGTAIPTVIRFPHR